MEDILPGDMEVTQIVNRVYASNSYILYRFQHDEAWLVDVGDADVIIRWIEEHSKKAQEARERFVSLMGDLPRIELFARQSTPGWDVWGNEVASDIRLAERM